MTQIGTAYVNLKFDPAAIAAITTEARATGDAVASEIGGAGKKAGGFLSSGLIGSIAGSAGKLGAVIGAALAVDKLVHFGASAVEVAAQTQKSTEAISADFGKAAKSVLAFNENASKLGISNEAGQQFAASIGLVTKNLGLGAAQGGTMAVGLEKIAGAVGLIKGQDPSTFFDALTKSLLGNTRGMKDLGIAITPVAEKNEALALGIKGSASGWTAGQKAAVIYGIAMKDLPALMDQAKQHSGDLADSQLKLHAELSNVEEEIGKALLPTATRFAAFLARELPVAIADTQHAVNQLSAVWDRNRATIEADLHQVERVVNAVMPAVKTIVQNDLRVIGDVFQVVSDIIQGHWSKAWHDIEQTVKDAARGVVSNVEALGPLVEKAINGIARLELEAAKGIGEAIIHGIEQGAESLAGDLESKIESIAKGALDAAKGALGIGSPSRVFAEQVGMPIAAGIALGIDKNAGLVSSSLIRATLPSASAYNREVPRISPQLLAAPDLVGTGSGLNVHVHNVFYIDGKEFRGIAREEVDLRERELGRIVAAGKRPGM